MAVDLALQMGQMGRGMWQHRYAIWWVGLILFLAFLALLAVGVALLWRRGGSTAAERALDDALATVRMRYARGEMSREEFLLAHQDLGGAPASLPPSPPPPPPPASS